MRLSRHTEQLFAVEYLIDCDPEAAARRVGVMRSPGFYGRALLRRPGVQAIIAREMESRRVRIGIDADFVLSELARQYVRLTGMLGHDIAELYAEDGSILPIGQWPAIWRERLVTEIHQEDTYDYSKDGVQAGASKTWDKSGRITRIKRESSLGIEKELRACLAEIGRHTDVNAFPQPKGNEINITVVSAEKARQVVSARRRLALAEGAEK